MCRFSFFAAILGSRALGLIPFDQPRASDGVGSVKPEMDVFQPEFVTCQSVLRSVSLEVVSDGSMDDT